MKKNNLFFTTVTILSILIVSMLYMLLYPHEDNTYMISVIVPNSSNNMWKRFEAGMRQASENDNVNINFVNTTEMETLADQENLILNELKNGADGIITQFIDSSNTESIISEIVDRSNLELLSEADAYDIDAKKISKINVDETLIATTLTSQIFDELGRNLSFKRACIIAGNQNQNNLKIRLNTIKDILEDAGVSITNIVEGNEDALNEQLKYIDEPSFLVSLDSISLDSAISYAREYNIPLYGIGCSDQSVSAMDNGVIHAMIVPDAYMMGYKAVHTMYRKLYIKQDKIEAKVDFYVVNRNTMFTSRNSKILFPIGE